MSKIFGGSKQTSKSSNQAYGDIKNAFSPLFGYAGQGAQGASDLLSGDASGFNAYKDATGFDFLTEQGSRGITGNAAARGLLRSGSTGKALANYGNQMQNQYASDYLGKLLGLSQVGLGAGNLVAGAGQVSESKGKSKPGLGGLIGGLASGFAAG